MNQRKLHKLEEAGIDPAYLDELYDHLASKWARKVENAKRYRQQRDRSSF